MMEAREKLLFCGPKPAFSNPPGSPMQRNCRLVADINATVKAGFAALGLPSVLKEKNLAPQAEQPISSTQSHVISDEITMPRPATQSKSAASPVKKAPVVPKWERRTEGPG